MAQKEQQSNARKFDQFYTDPKIAQACIGFAHDQLAHLEIERTIEPSAGAGAFSNHLGQACTAIDIDPRHKDILKADFLTWQPDASGSKPLVIGNPPFGKNASLAVRFFNHAAGFAEAIAFIVPKSFRKASIQARLDRNFHLVASMPLPETAFLFEGRPYAVPCEFQVWKRRDETREILRPIRSHPDFEFCTREEADFAVQRVGANAGRIKDIDRAGSKNSHYFIRATGSPSALRALFEQLDFDAFRLNTGGVPSVSKAELVALYVRCLEEGTFETTAAYKPAMPLERAGIQAPNVGRSIERQRCGPSKHLVGAASQQLALRTRPRRAERRFSRHHSLEYCTCRHSLGGISEKSRSWRASCAPERTSSHAGDLPGKPLPYPGAPGRGRACGPSPPPDR